MEVEPWQAPDEKDGKDEDGEAASLPCPALKLPWPERLLERRRAFQEIFNAFYEQVLHGCNDSKCKTSTCAGFRRSECQGSFRPYTSASARSLALHLASEAHPLRRLCPAIRIKREAIANRTLTSQVEYTSSVTNGASPPQSDQDISQREFTLLTGGGFLPSKQTKVITSQSVENIGLGTKFGNATRNKAESVRQTYACHQTAAESGVCLVGNPDAPIQPKDSTSLMQNCMDASALTLLHVARLPQLITNCKRRNSSVQAADVIESERPSNISHIRQPHINPEAKEYLDSIDFYPSHCWRAEAGITLSNGNHSPNDPDHNRIGWSSAQDGEVESSRHDMAFRRPRSAMNFGTDKASKAIQNECEILEILQPPAKPISFACPRMMIEENALQTKPESALTLASTASHPIFSVSSDSSCRDALRTGILTAGLCQLQRTHCQAPFIWQSKELCNPHVREIVERTRTIVDLLCSSRSLLLCFANPTIPANTGSRMLSFGWEKMIKCFLPLFFLPVESGIVLPSLWQTAKCLYPPPCGRKPQQQPFNALFSFVDPDYMDLSDTAEVVHIAKVVFSALVSFTNPYTSMTAWTATQILRQRGRNAPPSGMLGSSALKGITIQLNDSLNDEAAYSLIKRACIGIACRSRSLLPAESTQDDRESPKTSAELNFVDTIVRSLDQQYKLVLKPSSLSDKEQYSFFEGFVNPEPSSTRSTSLECLVEWLRNVLISEWDGKDLVSNQSATDGALQLMSIIYKFYAGRRIAPEIFQTPFISDRLNVLGTPLTWMEARHKGSSHLLDYPFLFNSSTLVGFFRAINFASMSKASRESKVNTLLRTRLDFSPNMMDSFGNAPRGSLRQSHRLSRFTNLHLVLDIRREYLLQDAFDQLWRRQKRELLRPMKVRLGQDYSEEGSDHGGVQQEFVRIAVAEAMDPKYGAFTTDPTNHMSWFQPGSLEPLYKFELLGLLVSLAIYNGLILPFSFPIALYMKLLNHEPDCILDIVDGWPDLARGLSALHEWSDGDVEDAFCRTYTFSLDVFGVRKDIDMIPPTTTKGATSEDSPPMVTNANREAYIRDYIRQLTSISVEQQYEAFAKGFKTVTNPKSLNLFTPTALQTLVQGAPRIDTHALEAVTQYDGGFTRDHLLISHFWSIVHGWASPPSTVESSTTPWSVPQDDRDAQEAGQAKVRGLLEFVTASDRLPAGGESRVTFLIQKNGTGDERLPTSMTCFGHLLLPDYSSREVLEQKLIKAVENAKGFGQP